MKVQLIIIINTILLVEQSVHIKTIPILEENGSITKQINNTQEINFEFGKLTCKLHKDCEKNSWCDGFKCKCISGWLTWYNNQPCSYKQLSKISACIISFLVGNIGIDWFFLSRRDTLYILLGLLKLLISIASCIWNRLAMITKTETSITMADCLGTSLPMIAFVWWLTDWIRILFNNFPDGNGAPLF